MVFWRPSPAARGGLSDTWGSVICYTLARGEGQGLRPRRVQGLGLIGGVASSIPAKFKDGGGGLGWW